MTRFRASLLAAAVIAGIPAMAHAQDDRRGGRPIGVGRDPGNVAASPGQGDRGSQSRPEFQAPQQQQPRPDFGGRQGQGNFAGRPGQFDNRGDRGDRPATPPPGAGGDRGRPDGFDQRGRPNGFQGDRGGQRFDGFGRPGGPGFGGQPPRGSNGFRPDWRNDRRYDWRGYRNDNRQLFRAPRYVPPRGYSFGYRPFLRGYQLDPFFYGQSYWLNDPWDYRLPPAYGPYRWVRYYNDVLLVDIETGFVVDAIQNFFW